MGVKVKDGVVIGVEKLIISKMLEEGANRRIYTIDKHIGMVRMHFSLILSSHLLV